MEDQDRPVPTLFMIPLMQVIAAFLLLAALLHGQRELTLLTLLVMILYGGVNLWTRISLSGITCHSEINRERVFPDEKILFKTIAENRKFLPVWLQVKVPLDGSLTPASGESLLTDESALLWHQGIRFQWELTARRRGVHRIGPLSLLAGDLFAFLSRERREEALREVIVYPRLVPLKPFSIPKNDLFGIPGAKSPVQDPIYILGTRDYQNGRPAKHIHWKASARHHRLQEKLFEPTAEEKVLLIVDVASFAKSCAEEAFERTLEIVASVALKLDRRNCAVGLLTNGLITGEDRATAPLSRSPGKMSSILECLARLQMKAAMDLMDLLRSGVDLPGGASCMSFSYAEDETVSAMSQYFGHRRIPVMSFVCALRSDSAEGNFEDRRTIRSLDDLSIGKV
jgi:uncharacterized protein (DUF58 family)